MYFELGLECVFSLNHKAPEMKPVDFGSSIDPDEAALAEPPHLDLYCLPSWSGCSKLTTSLVNVSLKFQTLISQIRQYFFVEKI